jgi:hypothetical protein
LVQQKAEQILHCMQFGRYLYSSQQMVPKDPFVEVLKILSCSKWKLATDQTQVGVKDI